MYLRHIHDFLILLLPTLTLMGYLKNVGTPVGYKRAQDKKWVYMVYTFRVNINFIIDNHIYTLKYSIQWFICKP